VEDSELGVDEIGWYVSDIHCRRAIMYLCAKLIEDRHLPPVFELDIFMELWAEALKETMVMNEPSPLGPDPEAARKFLLSAIERRLTQMEERGDRIENAISTMAVGLVEAQTGFSEPDRKGIDRILYGIETASKSRPYTPKQR
jgi:hypothetical protein